MQSVLFLLFVFVAYFATGTFGYFHTFSISGLVGHPAYNRTGPVNSTMPLLKPSILVTGGLGDMEDPQLVILMQVLVEESSFDKNIDINMPFDPPTANRVPSLPISIFSSSSPPESLTNMNIFWTGAVDFTNSNISRGVHLYQTVVVPGAWKSLGVNPKTDYIGLMVNATGLNTTYDVSSMELTFLPTIMPTGVDYMFVDYKGCPGMSIYSQTNLIDPDPSNPNPFATNISLKLGEINFQGVYSNIYAKFNSSPTPEDYHLKLKVGTNLQQYYQIGPLLDVGTWYVAFECVTDSKPETKFRMDIKNQCKLGCFTSKTGHCKWDTSQCVCSRWISGDACQEIFPGVWALLISGTLIFCCVGGFIIFKAIEFAKYLFVKPKEHFQHAHHPSRTLNSEEVSLLHDDMKENDFDSD